MAPHKNPRVSIGLPVYNGENYVREAVDSILAQTFEDFELLISDNASTDATEEIGRAYAARDPRVRYRRNPENVGAAGNYERVFERASGEYFKWAAHDDVYYPEFLSRCVDVLDREPSVAVCHTRTRLIDAKGQAVGAWSLGGAVAYSNPNKRFRSALALKEMYFIWGLMRREQLARTSRLGPFVGHDRSLLSALSLFGSFYEAPDELFGARMHEEQSVHAYDWHKPRQAIAWYSPDQAGKLIFPAWRLLAEHVKGIHRAPLSLPARVRCHVEMTRWIKNQRRALISDVILAGAHTSGPWLGRLTWLDPTARAISTTIPADDTFILVDDEMLERELFGTRHILPFLEKDGIYWGRPADDEEAVRELDRLHRSGARFIVFVPPTFWWLDYYSGFHAYLRERFRCVLENKRLVIFDLRA